MSVAPWDPQRYLAFADARTRPAVDLLNAVPPADPDRVVDLGCGAGTVTALLRERWPTATITGVDRDAAMLARARDDHPDLAADWVEADLEDWQPDASVDVVVSNAVLHWVDDHARVLPRLLTWLAADGVLAVQMPANHAAPTHVLAREIAREGPWAARLRPLLRPEPVAPAATYVDLLAPLTATVDVWTTTYEHLLTGDDPVVRWTSGSMLRPLLAALDPDEAAAFEGRYRERIRRAYPRRPDGTTLLPFTRRFVVATVPG